MSQLLKDNLPIVWSQRQIMPSFQLIVPLNSLSISYLAVFYKEEAKSENNMLCIIITIGKGKL